MATFTMDSDLDPWDLVLAHRYSEALAAYDERQGTHREDPLETANRAVTLLCLGKLEEALEEYRRANFMAADRLHGETQPHLTMIGVILWLLGQREDAMLMFRKAVDGVINGTVKLADNAGGVSQGLLLWYAGVTAQNVSAKKHALDYLMWLARKPRAKEWPGPVARLVLGEAGEGDVLHGLCGASDLEEAINQGTTSLLLRRRLIRVVFYSSVRYRDNGAEEQCHSGMCRCALLENPILEGEWYLAQAECHGNCARNRPNFLPQP